VPEHNIGRPAVCEVFDLLNTQEGQIGQKQNVECIPFKQGPIVSVRIDADVSDAVPSFLQKMDDVVIDQSRTAQIFRAIVVIDKGDSHVIL
jgi:hypothetical protein